MPNRNTQRRIAPWFRSRDPVVIYADKFTVTSIDRVGVPIKGPTTPGYWWGADDGWTGPFATHAEALADGRNFLEDYFSRSSRR